MAELSQIGNADRRWLIAQLIVDLGGRLALSIVDGRLAPSFVDGPFALPIADEPFPLPIADGSALTRLPITRLPMDT